MIFSLYVDSTLVDMEAMDAILVRAVLWSKDGATSVTVQRRGIPLPGLPDPWLGKSCELQDEDNVVWFRGQMVSYDPPFEDKLGWVLTYQALGLRYVGNLVPVTDANTGTDTVAFNLHPDDPTWIASRAGRTVGQIIQAVLEMQDNAERLDALGIGNYTSLSPPTLPTATTDDLDLLTVIPPFPVYIGGEKILDAIQDFLTSTAPNHTLWIEPTGNIRVLDLRDFSTSPTTLTLGQDPVPPPELRRDITDSFQRVVVKGQPYTEPVIVSLARGTLEEDFAHDALSNAAAKAAWVLDDFLQTQTAADSGDCTCGSTTSVTVTSDNASAFWSADFWDQTSGGAHGVIYLTYSIGSGINQVASRRIIANTSLTPGGTSDLTLDTPLPNTNYDHYEIYGKQSGASIVWRKYHVVDPDIGAAMANQFSYPVPFRFSTGDAVTLTSYPQATVIWGTSPPYLEAVAGMTQDPSSGTIMLERPSVMWSEPDQNNLETPGGYAEPVNIQALLAIYKGFLTATSPADISSVPQYAGTSNTEEGLERTLYVMCSAWRDPSNQANMDDYAAHILDSVKDTIIEGVVVYLGDDGPYEPALTPGMSLNITGDNGSPVTIGWEAIALPVVETVLTWPQGGGSRCNTTMKVSNRRAQYTGDLFCRPGIGDAHIGLRDGESNMLMGLEGAVMNGYALPGAAGEVLGMTNEVLGSVIDQQQSSLETVGGIAGEALEGAQNLSQDALNEANRQATEGRASTGAEEVSG